MCVVVVLALIAWPLSVRLAGRRPHHRNPQRGQLRGLVQGGQHVGFELTNIFRYDAQGLIEDEHVQTDNRSVLQQLGAEND